MAAAPPAPTSRLRVVVGEEELLRARAVSAVRAAVLERHPDAEVHELAAAGLPIGQLADVLAPSLFGGHRLVVVHGRAGGGRRARRRAHRLRARTPTPT